MVGLAVARAMSLSGVTSIVLEKHSRIGYCSTLIKVI